jgi:hypothetical protein
MGVSLNDLFAVSSHANAHTTTPQQPCPPHRAHPHHLPPRRLLLTKSSTRRSLLSTLSLLCHSSHTWATPLLYSSPLIDSPRQLDLFLRTLKRSPALAEQVEALRLDGWSRRGDGDIAGYRKKMTHRLPGIMKRCRGLKEVGIAHCIVFDLDDFKGAEGGSFGLASPLAAS